MPSHLLLVSASIGTLSFATPATSQNIFVETRSNNRKAADVARRNFGQPNRQPLLGGTHSLKTMVLKMINHISVESQEKK
jgi:hypothetical protein